MTKLKLETQICVFDPILCHAPEIIDMTNTDNSWNGIITTLEKHSYVNWRIHIVYENGSEILVPERSEGYAKVWSTCWEIMQDQEIITGGDKCDDVIDEDGNIAVNITNENFTSIESGINYRLSNMAVKANFYLTNWNDRNLTLDGCNSVFLSSSST